MKEFSKRYGVPERTVRDWCESGRLAARTISRVSGGVQWVIDITDQPDAPSIETVNREEITGENGITVVDVP